MLRMPKRDALREGSVFLDLVRGGALAGAQRYQAFKQRRAGQPAPRPAHKGPAGEATFFTEAP